MYYYRAELVEILMVEEAFALMSYRMHSLGWSASWGCVQLIAQPLVLLHYVVCNLMGELQSLSIPPEISFLEYYSFVATIRASIGLQFYMGLWHECSVPSGEFIWVMTISPSAMYSSSTMSMTTATTITYTSVSSVAPAVTSATASSIILWNLRLLCECRAGWMN